MTRARGSRGANLAHRLDAFHHRHAQVEQRDVGMVLLERGDRLDAVDGLGDDLQIGLLVDDVGDAGAHQRVIVDEQHGRARGGARPSSASDGNMDLRRQ